MGQTKVFIIVLFIIKCRLSWTGSYVKTSSGLVGCGPWQKMLDVSSPTAGYIFNDVAFLEGLSFLETGVPISEENIVQEDATEDVLGSRGETSRVLSHIKVAGLIPEGLRPQNH